MRDVSDGTGWIAAVTRLTAGRSEQVVLPLYVDEATVSEDNRRRIKRTIEVEVMALGVDGAMQKSLEVCTSKDSCLFHRVVRVYH